MLVALGGVLLLAQCGSSLELSDFKDMTPFAAVQLFMKHHPKEARQIVDGFLDQMPEGIEKEDVLKEIDLAFATTHATGAACTACKAGVFLLKNFLRFVPYPEFEQTVIDGCYLFLRALSQLTNVREMCLVIPLQGPHVAAVIQSVNINATVPIPGTNLTQNLPPPYMSDLCFTMNVCYDTPSQDDVLMNPTPSSIVSDLSRPAMGRKDTKTESSKTAKRTTFKIAQITDIHIELDYAANSATSCGLYICCQAKHGPGDSMEFGHYECNVPRKTMELFFHEIASHAPDFVIFTGDIPPHTMWDETMDSQLQCSQVLTDSLKTILNGSTVYPSIGNHEMYPTNLFSVREISNDTVPMVTAFAEMWTDLAHFTPAQITSMLEGGYYTTMAPAPFDKLRILSINTNYMYTANYYNVLNLRQRPGILNGEAVRMKNAVTTILSNARTDGEKVIVIYHHPPGGSSSITSESRWLEKTMVDFSDIVVLQMAGHTHTDEFKLLKDSNNTAQSMVYVSPSIDAHGWKNPSMRVYYMDDTYELLDYEQYFFNITQYGNSAQPRIEKLYKASEEYGLSDMKPSSWMDLLKRFETDQALLLKHRGHSNANAGTVSTSCDANCRRHHVCRQMHANYDHFEVCAAGPQPATTPSVPVSSTWPPLQKPDQPVAAQGVATGACAAVVGGALVLLLAGVLY